MLIHCPNCDCVIEVENSGFAQLELHCPVCLHEFENPAVVTPGEDFFDDEQDCEKYINRNPFDEL